MISFTSLAADHQIGASCFVLNLDGTQVVLDAGTHPKLEGLASLPRLKELPYDSVATILLTHAHLDHSGALPVLLRQHPSARVFMSEATRSLIDALLHNSVNVMTSQRSELGIMEYPLFSHREVEDQFDRWETAPLGLPFPVDERSSATVEFVHAGHILGAISLLIRFCGKRILYTGDIHFEDQTITPGANLPGEPIDTLIIETTRGGSPRQPDYTRAREVQKLADAINDTIERRGVILIPVFAMGKTQELLLILHELKRARTIPDSPIHIGGLSTKMTAIYDNLAYRSTRLHPGFQILREIKLVTSPRRKKQQDLPYHPGSIYALSSGMMTEKTPSNEFAQRVIGDPRSSILFVGYADPDSPAGSILRAAPEDELQLHRHAARKPLLCHKRQFDFSGHASRDAILRYVLQVKPRVVILIHGDRDALAWFQAEIAQALPQTRLILPQPGQPYSLD